MKMGMAGLTSVCLLLPHPTLASPVSLSLCLSPLAVSLSALVARAVWLAELQACLPKTITLHCAGEFARAVSMLEHGEREMDRKVVAIAQQKARELQDSMTRAESYEQGRALQVQYKVEMAQTSAILTAERHAQRRKLEERLQMRNSRLRQRAVGAVSHATPAITTALVAMMSANYLQSIQARRPGSR